MPTPHPTVEVITAPAEPAQLALPLDDTARSVAADVVTDLGTGARIFSVFCTRGQQAFLARYWPTCPTRQVVVNYALTCMGGREKTDLTGEQIAADLGMSAAAVRQHLSIAYRQGVLSSHRAGFGRRWISRGPVLMHAAELANETVPGTAPIVSSGTHTIVSPGTHTLDSGDVKDVCESGAHVETVRAAASPPPSQPQQTHTAAAAPGRCCDCNAPTEIGDRGTHYKRCRDCHAAATAPPASSDSTDGTASSISDATELGRLDALAYALGAAEEAARTDGNDERAEELDCRRDDAHYRRTKLAGRIAEGPDDKATLEQQRTAYLRGLDGYLRQKMRRPQRAHLTQYLYDLRDELRAEGMDWDEQHCWIVLDRLAEIDGTRPTCTEPIEYRPDETMHLDRQHAVAAAANITSTDTTLDEFISMGRRERDKEQAALANAWAGVMGQAKKLADGEHKASLLDYAARIKETLGRIDAANARGDR